VIVTFADSATARFWETGKGGKGWPKNVAKRKLQILDKAAELRDLMSPPGNRLEKLAGDRKGRYSIRINDQYRICFRWNEGDAEDVEISKHYE